MASSVADWGSVVLALITVPLLKRAENFVPPLPTVLGIPLEPSSLLRLLVLWVVSLQAHKRMFKAVKGELHKERKISSYLI